MLAYTGDGPIRGGWSSGKVVAQWCQGPGMDRPMPYQIVLDDPKGVLIMAPLDDDSVVQRNIGNNASTARS